MAGFLSWQSDNVFDITPCQEHCPINEKARDLRGLDSAYEFPPLVQFRLKYLRTLLLLLLPFFYQEKE